MSSISKNTSNQSVFQLAGSFAGGQEHDEIHGKTCKKLNVLVTDIYSYLLFLCCLNSSNIVNVMLAADFEGGYDLIYVGTQVLYT